MSASMASPLEHGWYFYDAEYPDEGVCGPFASEAEARAFIDPTDESDYSFLEHPKPEAA